MVGSPERGELASKFIRAVYYTIVQSLDDRYCYCVETGRKIYENSYDHYLSLWPGFTVKHLVQESNFPDLIDAWCQFNYLANQLNVMVVKFRLLYRSNLYPRQRPELINEAVVKKGDQMVEISSRLLMTGEQNDGQMDSLGKVRTVNDPKMELEKTGSTCTTWVRSFTCLSSVLFAKFYLSKRTW